MTAFHNDGKISAAEITAIWKETLLPEMKTISLAVLIDMMRQAFLMLKDGLAPGAWPGKLVLDWKSPSVTVMYDAQQRLPAFDPLWQTKADPLTLPDVDLTAKEARNFAKKLNEFLSDAMPGFVLGLLTNGVILRSDKNGKEDIFISPDSKAWQIIQALPEAERQAKAQELAAGDEFSPIKASGTVDTPMGKQSVCVSLVFQIIPLTLDQQRGSAYYQIVARLDFTEGDPSAWPEEDRQKLFDGLLKCFNEKTFELVKQKVKKTEEDFKKEVKRLKKQARPIKYETVKKPKALQDSEAATVTAIMNWHDMTPSLFQCTLQELQTFCDQSNFAQLANSYGFLTDAILLYLKRFTDQKTTAVSIGRFTPTAGNMNIKLDEIIIIDDTMQNFCAAAGITNPKERRQLIEEIKANKFSQIGWSRREKKDVRLTAKSFMAYQFTSVRVSKLKNLLNVKKADAIERVRLEINKNIFDAALIPGKNTGTKGYHLYPAKLERALKDTVQKHSAELRTFCTSANYSHVKGGKYTSAIRPLFNLLIREVTGSLVNIDGQNYLPVMKPIKTYAQTCCESTFYTKRGDKQFKRQMAVEHLTYALEVLKFLWADGLQRVEIKDYCFIDTHLKITLRNHFGSKKTGLEVLPDRQI